ncbi:MAG: PKD domain-containing protein [Candidatus Aenigmarchaeota archaeon]|nr:PKD domain-containing protein [Candidatus Aenigmarchaeota archaeon]
MGKIRVIIALVIFIIILAAAMNLWKPPEQPPAGDGQATNEPPSAAFTYSPQNPKAGGAVNFDASQSSDSDGFISSYSWKIGSAILSGKTVQRVFASAGTFSVNLTVTDNKGAKSSATKLMTVASSGTSATGTNVTGKCVQPPGGIIGWWPGDGNADDITGKSNGIIHGATFGTGIVGQGFVFDGIDDYIELGEGPGLSGSGTWTIEAWITPQKTRSYATIISQGIVDKNAPSAQIDGFAFQTKWRAIATGYTRELYFSINAASGWTNIYNPLIGRLSHHVVVMRENDDKLVFWINGNPEGYQMREIREYPDTRDVQYVRGDVKKGPVFIGSFGGQSISDSENSNGFFLGTIDELTIYNRALTESEIKGIFKAGGAGKCR